MFGVAVLMRYFFKIVRLVRDKTLKKHLRQKKNPKNKKYVYV